MFLVKYVPWVLDIKVCIPKIENQESDSFLATIKTVAFCQRDVSAHPETRHIITKTLKSYGVWELC